MEDICKGIGFAVVVELNAPPALFFRLIRSQRPGLGRLPEV